jgi:hypothetical protein
LLVFYLSGKHPRNDRYWSKNQAILPFAEFRKNGKVFIKNIRHCSYKTADDYSVSYYDREYDINRLKKVWFLLVHFIGWKGAAHAFVSFEFEDETFVSVSVEQRRQKGEEFSAIKGLFRQFELMYVIADERDTILLRTEHHKNNIFLYPLKLSKEKEKELFCDILKRANALAKNPEFYHSITNACFGNIVDHINNILPKKMPFDYRIILPENADFYAHELDLLDTELSPKEARKKHLINSLAKKYANDPNFSLRIRGK